MNCFNKKEKIIFAGFLALITSTLAFASYASLAIFNATTAESGVYTATIGLRSYFQRGLGTEADPFVISRPIHFRNLTRLQNLGVFPAKTYFTLGFDPERQNATVGQSDTYDPYGTLHGTSNLKFYSTNESTTMIDYLNMETMGSVLSVGNEGSPFQGIFNGNGKEIKHLSVQSGPEDVGVFGYTYSGSKVSNVYFDDLTVTDNGYNSEVNHLPLLYGDDAQLTLNPSSVSYLLNGTNNTLTSSSGDSTNSFSDLSGVFVPSYPSNAPTGISFEFRSSSEYFSKNSEGNLIVNTGDDDEAAGRYSIANNTNFTLVNNAALSTRLSIVAKIFSENIYYSKVLRTYKVTFHNSISSGVSTITMSALLDYVNPADNTDTTYTEYAHGVNIGYLIGHCDGSCENCYIHDADMSLNNDVANVVKQAQESETGLIGEVGPALNSEFTPAKVYDSSGDTGVVNFTKMFKDVMGSSVSASDYTSIDKDGDNTGDYYISVPQGGSASKYTTFMRKYPLDTTSYASKDTLSVDFKGRQIIQDEDAVNRNLGVFSLVTASDNNSVAGDTDSFYYGIGSYEITNAGNSGSVFNDFYYTTAEWSDLSETGIPASTWSYSNSSSEHIEIGGRLPLFSSLLTWNPTMEKKFNFLIHCSLSSTAVNNYFYNIGTGSAFFRNYFSYKLIDKNGDSVVPASKDFGVFCKNVDKEASPQITNIASFDTSLKMTGPSSTTSSTAISTMNITQADATSLTVPTNTIDFSVKNDNGANVTVMAASTSASEGSYVGIYDKSIALNSTHNVASNKSACKPSYAMYIPYVTLMEHTPYFEYSYDTGAVNYVNHFTPTSSGTPRLYAHTFKLPKGEYFISSPYKSVSIYYVCAQGQNGAGNLGNEVDVYSNNNVIADVDFLSNSINTSGFSTSFDRCYFSFESKFSNLGGDLKVQSTRNVANSSDSKDIYLGSAASLNSAPANLTKLLALNSHYSTVHFNGNTYVTKYVTYPSA